MNDKIPVMNGRLLFDEAFAYARASGYSEFVWNNTQYHTKTREELEKQNRVRPEERIVDWVEKKNA